MRMIPNAEIPEYSPGGVPIIPSDPNSPVKKTVNPESPEVVPEINKDDDLKRRLIPSIKVTM